MCVARQMLHSCAMRFILSAALLTALASGCYATTTGSVGYSGAVTTTYVAPDLVYVSPGVQVIADYDEPVFYSDGFYWRESNGIWFRSNYHTHGWVSYSAPRHVLSIQNRHSYRRYRPAGYSPRVRDNRRYDNRPVVRDHRQPYNRQPYNQPVVRDHRDHRAQPVVRDNRTYQQPVVRDNRGTHQPVVRDNRGTHQQPTVRDNRRRDDRRDNRRDHR
jgi:hypothetical protein